VRLFIAVPLPPELANRAAALVPPALPALKRVRPELMHITLAFLGWTPDEQLPTVIEATMAAAAGQHPFELSFAGAGRFPPSGRPRVVWLGVGDGKTALETIAGRVVDELRAHQLRFDDRPFAPHLTLARVHADASGAEARTVGAAVDELAVPDLRTRVEQLAVVQSVLSPKGPRYTTRAAAPLR
jgi:2'-5' RNA ligase